jgi:polysaccharide deacetylase 2 family uncharacterized protein YibQ
VTTRCGRALVLLALLGSGVASAAPVMALIIDDLGNQLAEGRRAVDLPGPVAMAILPGTPHAVSLAERAHAAGKPVMLHLPLAALDEKALGPGGIGLDATRPEFERILTADLAAVPHVQGVNNHMGSLLTQHPGHMAWLMQGLAARGLFFVDSRTTERSVALQLAREAGVPTVSRDVFLDDDPGEPAVRAEFERLVARSLATGRALGIGHPHPATLRVLEDELPRLTARGITLVPVTDLLMHREERP